MRHILDGDSWGVDVYDKNKSQRTYIKFKPSPNIKAYNEVIVELSIGEGETIMKYGKECTVHNQFKRIPVYIIPASEARIKLKSNRASTVVVFPKKSLKILSGSEQGKIITGWQILNDIKQAIELDVG